MGDLTFDRYIRKPFQIQAVEITEENISELAKLLVSKIETEHGKKYILLNRQIVPNVARAYIGWYVTKMRDNLRCYNPGTFAEQFLPMPQIPVASFTFPDGDDEAPCLVFTGDPTVSVGVTDLLTHETLSSDIKSPLSSLGDDIKTILDPIVEKSSVVRHEVGSAPPFEGGV